MLGKIYELTVPSLVLQAFLPEKTLHSSAIAEISGPYFTGILINVLTIAKKTLRQKYPYSLVNFT